MIVFRSPEEVPGGFGPSAVAIGKFDGVHAGHRAVIERLKEAAAATGSRAVAVTFDRNPLAVIRPDRCPENVVTVERKLELLGGLGLDATLVLTFDEEMAARSAEDFVVDILVGALQVSTVLVGQDFRFGHRGAGTPELLRELGPRYGFSVEVVDDVYLPGSPRRVSSSWIRELLMEGDVASAATVLGRYPDVRGEVVHGLKRGRELGFPTANLSTIVDAFVPPTGCTPGGSSTTTPASVIRPRSRWARIRPSTTCSYVRSRRTCWGRPGSTCTDTMSRSSSWRGCGAWSPSRASRS